ncbi:MAG: YeeE/YedE family protein [Burkholderiales bacterium]|nr:YeeE/YedE family protein [Burkholderiales bacterium]
MVTPLSPALATQLVLWGGLAIGAVLGALAQATRFCTMGALADWFAFGGRARLMMWLLAVMVAATGSLALAAFGWLDPTRTLPWASRLPWLSCLVGGAIFGAGMVLASGCPQRNLVRAGAGSLKAVVTLVVTALAAQMTLRGVLGAARVRWLDPAALQLATPQDLGSLLAALTGGQAGALRWALLALLLATGAVLLWRARASLQWGDWLGGAGVGLLVTAGWALTGHLGYLAENPDTLEPAWMGTYSHRPESLSFVAPLAQGLDLLTLWTDNNAAASFGMLVALGVLLGSAVSARWRGEFHVEAYTGAADLVRHLVGAVMMGFGGVTALGCSIGQGITGLAMLSAGSVLAVAGIVAGALGALQLQARQLERQAA